MADYEWPLLDWARYLSTIHVVRLFAGAAFRSTPMWALYLRLNGARTRGAGAGAGGGASRRIAALRRGAR